MNWLKIYLPIYLLCYFAIAFILPTWRAYRQTGIWPVTFGRSASAHDYLGRLMKWLVLGLFLSTIFYALGDPVYRWLVPVTYLQIKALHITGLLLIHLSLAWIFIAQLQMGNSWRIGIDASNPTTLVTRGLFSISRNPVFLGMIVTAWGLFAILPNALSFFTALGSYWIIQVQIRLEEAFLQQQLGATYRQYQKKNQKVIIMKHQHQYNSKGRQICCTQEQKVYAQAGAQNLVHGLPPKNEHDQDHEHSDDDGHDHSNADPTTFRMFLPALISFVLLLTGIALDNWIQQSWFTGWIRIGIYIAAYLPVGLPVVKDAAISIGKGEVFSEFLLMSIATIGAFIIQEYPEGVAVMLFYAVGEVFQTLAVSRAKRNIKALLDQRPDEVTIIKDNQPVTVKAEQAAIGDIIQLKPGEKLGLDGELLSETASFNTAALTGESKPDTKSKGSPVLAGMINLNTVSQVKVTTAYTDSKLSKILELVQSATAQKAPTELFIRKFAKVYTPIVVFLAIGICIVPYFFVDDYVFRDWLYRALIFLVISCPCALVISIPLGYFGGIGAASRNGILFKGSNYLDIIASIQHVVMDKTGTLTEGVFKVQEVVIQPEFNKDEILKWVNALESISSHPVATAIREYAGEVDHSIHPQNAEEIPGHGLKASINGKELLAGNFKLMDKFNIAYDMNPTNIVYTIIAIAYDGKFAGYITIADNIKEDAKLAIEQLHQLNIKATMLSGDKTSVVKDVAGKVGIDNAFGDLLPEDKVNKVKEIKAQKQSVAFVGDGVNDAPVVALSDAGIAMGGLGSDATIETADIVIQDDKPGKIPVAINIGRQTKKIVWQNITLAFVVKGIVLILGAGGLATMWEAVFADVGVALLAILNAVRIQRMQFNT